MDLPNMPELKNEEDYSSDDKLRYVLAFILEYTGPFYKMLEYNNSSIKETYKALYKRDYDEDVTINKIKDFVDEFIKVSKPWPIKLYRGVNLSEQELNKHLKDPNNVSMGDISSWTSKLNVAAYYAQGEEDTEVIYLLEDNKSAVSISHLSMFYDEGEFLAASTTKYKVVKKENKTTNHTKRFHVYLEEVEEK